MRYWKNHLYSEEKINMSMHSAGFHHLNIRKRTKKKAKRMAKRMVHKMVDDALKHSWYTKNVEGNPAKLKKIMDKLIYGIALIWPILTIPQVWMVWVDKNAAWLSLFTWTAYVVSPTLWLIYGIIHKERAIIFSNILWIIVDIAVLTGASIYV